MSSQSADGHPHGASPQSRRPGDDTGPHEHGQRRGRAHGITAHGCRLTTWPTLRPQRHKHEDPREQGTDGEPPAVRAIRGEVDRQASGGTFGHDEALASPVDDLRLQRLAT